jgi:hypothetical protein
MASWLVAVAGALAALVAGVYAASRRQALSSAMHDLATLREELDAAREQTSKRADSGRKRDEELAELRRRLEKTKKRATQAREDERQESTRIRELDEKLRLAQADARSAQSELQRAEAELGRLREGPRAAPKLEAPRPTPKPAPPAPPSAGSDAAPPPDEALRRRVESAEARALALEEQLVAARVDAERQRRKVAAQDRLYLAIRGELDAKKERLRAQQEELERLRALRLVLADDLAEPAADDQERTL